MLPNFTVHIHGVFILGKTSECSRFVSSRRINSHSAINEERTGEDDMLGWFYERDKPHEHVHFTNP